MKTSIEMPVCNGERFIREQLDSFGYRTRLSDELAVSDNASTDRTVEIVRDFVARGPFPVQLFSRETHSTAEPEFVDLSVIISNCNYAVFRRRSRQHTGSTSVEPSSMTIS